MSAQLCQLNGDTIYSFITRHAATTPAADAILSSKNVAVSYCELEQLIIHGVEHLNSIGIGRNDRVATVLPQGPDMACASLIVSSGASCTPLNPDYTQSEFERYFSLLGAKLLVTAQNFGNPAREAAKKLAIPIIEFNAASNRNTTCFDTDPDNTKYTQTPNATGLSLPGDVAFVLLTSGSTSEPKLVPLTQRNVSVSAHNMTNSLALNANDRCLNMMPLFHVGGLVDLLVAPLLSGGSVIVGANQHSETFFECMTQFQPTWYQGVPTMLQDLISHAGINDQPLKNNSLRLIRSVSAPLGTVAKADIERYFQVPVVEIYGMTETTGLITSNGLIPDDQRSGSVGTTAGPIVKIIDPAGNPARLNQIGEIIVSGENVMAGYDDNPEANNEAFIGEWLRTGDEGYLDEDGFLYLTGRIKEIINRGGEKISPREIDDLATIHPSVREAATFPVIHESLGEEVAIAVVRQPNAELTERELTDFLSQQLAYFKVPRKVLFLDQLPKNANGKLQRHILAQDYGGAESNASTIEFVPPTSPTAIKLAATWERTLGIVPIGLNDNFFDLGGDSLKAATFISELQQDWQQSIQVFALYDHPTIAEFDQYLENLPQTSKTETGVGLSQHFTTLRHPMYQELAAYLTGWQGQRATPESLLVGRNTLGSRQPLFWCVQGFSEFAQLAKHLGSDQPVYGMRSLYLTSDKSDRANHALAAHYIDEILTIQPAGPYLVGGFCEGGKVAFEIAQQLKQKNHEISLLCLQDQFIPQPYDGRIAFFFCPSGKHSPYQHYRQPERGWSKFYTGERSVSMSCGTHDEYYSKPSIESFSADLKREIQRAQTSNSPISLPTVKDLKILPDDAYQATIQAQVPRFLKPNDSKDIPVTLTNNSQHNWEPTDISGIILGNRWLNNSGKPRSGLDGCTPLHKQVRPGASITLNLRIQVPAKISQRQLEIDLVDEGISWFKDKGSKPARFNVSIVPASVFWNRVWKSNRAED